MDHSSRYAPDEIDKHWEEVAERGWLLVALEGGIRSHIFSLLSTSSPHARQPRIRVPRDPFTAGLV
jgi:hypothetical protein